MKKLLVCLCMGLLLAGCGGSSGKEETKTCTMKVGTIEMAAAVTGKDDAVEKFKMTITYPASMMGGQDLSAITDEQKKELEKTVLDQYGIEEGKGVAVTADFTKEAMAVGVEFDLKDGDAEVLKKIGIEDTSNLKISDFVKQMEEGNATCE